MHGTVGQFGLIEPNEKHAAAIDSLKKRLELFSTLGVKKVYTTTTGGQKLALDDYSKIADQLRVVGETAKAFETMFDIEFVRDVTVHVDAAHRAEGDAPGCAPERRGDVRLLPLLVWQQ